MVALKNASVLVHRVYNDANTLIAETALEHVKLEVPVTAVASDTDMLVFLITITVVIC
jgi:hypothetical protein